MTITQDKIQLMTENSLEAFALFQNDQVIFENKVSKKYYDLSSGSSNTKLLDKIKLKLQQKDSIIITNTALRSIEKNTVYCDIEVGYLDQDHSLLWLRIKTVANELNQKRLLGETDSDIIFLEAMPRLYNDILFGIDPETKTLTHAGELFLQFGLPRVVENYPNSLIEASSIHPDDVEGFLRFSTGQFNGITGEFKTRIRLIDNTYEWFLISTTAVKDCNGNIVEILGKLANIQSQKLLEEVANFDRLTETLHNNSFQELVEKELLEEEGTLLFVDIDNFNQVNIDHGHDFGDTFLKKIGKKINLCVRNSDYVGRVAGDQFVIYFKKMTDEAFIEKKVKQFLKIAESPIREGDISHEFTLSVGLAHYPLHGKNYADLYKAAQKAMLCAKEDGGQQANLCQNNGVYRIVTLDDEPEMIHNALGMLDNNASAFVVFHKETNEVVSENKKARDMFFCENHQFNLIEVFGSAEKVKEIIEQLKNELAVRQMITLYGVEMTQNNKKKILCDLEFSYISDDRTYIYLKISEKNDKKIRLLKTLIEKIKEPIVVLNKDATFSISYANSLFYHEFGSTEDTFFQNYGETFTGLLLQDNQVEFQNLFLSMVNASPKGHLEIPLYFATGETFYLNYDGEKLKSMDSAHKIYCQLSKTPFHT